MRRVSSIQCLARLRDPRELLRRRERLSSTSIDSPVVMALAAVVRQVHITLPAAVAGPAPEVLVVQMGDRHLDSFVPHVVMRTVVGDQIAGQRADGVEKRLGRLRLGHIRLVDVAEKRRSVPVQFQRGKAPLRGRMAMGERRGRSDCRYG